MALPYYRNVSTNYAVAPGGDKLVIGAQSDAVTLIDFADLRRALTNGSASHLSFFDDFFGNAGVSAPQVWKKTAGSTGTAVAEGASGVAGGQWKVTTAATSSDCVTMALGLHFSATNGAVFYDAYVKLAQLTACAVEFGLSDAVSETAGLAFSDHTVASVTNVATDAAIFAYDSAAGANWMINTVKAGTPQAYDTGIAASTSAFVKLSYVLQTNGTIQFYVDDTLITTLDNAITTTVLLTPWKSIVATAAATKSFYVDYVGVLASR